MTKLESLPNEVFHELFEHIPFVNLLRAFHRLNSRFDNLLFVYFHAYRFDFQSITKQDFEFICQNYLQVIRNRIISLRLSDDNDTPAQINDFLSYTRTFRHFTYLKSVSLSHISHDRTLWKILLKLSDLPNLTHLKIIRSKYHRNTSFNYRILNHIWNFPKLTHCYLDISPVVKHMATGPIVISKSLKYFSMKHSFWLLDQLHILYEHTPHLQYLDIVLHKQPDNQLLLSPILSLTTLKIFIKNSANVIMNLLRSIPNLRYLSVRIINICIDGHQWEEIIVNHLPQLKNFRFQMDVRLPDKHHIDNLFDSFQTDFWINKHQWFIRCYWNTNDTDNTWSFFETLSCISPNITLYDRGYCSKSTCPYGDNKWSYNYTNILYYNSTPLTHCLLIPIQFNNILELYIKLPFHEYLWHYVPQFDHLILLDIGISDNTNDNDMYGQLQLLLSRAPRLYSLTVSSWPSSIPQNLLLKNTNASIRHLDLRGNFLSNNHRYFDEQYCNSLIHSSLGIQCEILVVDVQNRINVMNLINSMKNLRTLNISCQNEFGDSDNDLSEWLKTQLPSTCKITSNRYDNPWITRVWIR